MHAPFRMEQLIFLEQNKTATETITLLQLKTHRDTYEHAHIKMNMHLSHKNEYMSCSLSELKSKRFFVLININQRAICDMTVVSSGTIWWSNKTYSQKYQFTILLLPLFHFKYILLYDLLSIFSLYLDLSHTQQCTLISYANREWA